MNYLGIDFGTKRIGLAKAGEEMKIATPLMTVLNNEEVFDKIQEIIDLEEIKTVVVGLPISFDGDETDSTKRARSFGEELEDKLKIKINFWNEVLSTKQVQRYEVGDKDASAAALILQGFLDKK